MTKLRGPTQHRGLCARPRRAASAAARQLLLILLATPLAAQQHMPPVGSVDLYGLRQVADSTVRRVVGMKPGDALPGRVSNKVIVRRLRAIPGVQDAALSLVCCGADGRAMLFVGIRESGAPQPTFRAPPTGRAALPQAILVRDSIFGVRLMEAVRAGRSTEVDSGGHEFFVDSVLNSIQHEYLAFARTHIPLARDVLAHSASVRQRVLAAELLDYAPDVRTVIPDLTRAMHDPASDVRNAAMRALWTIAAYGQMDPALGIQVPAEPFIDMLWSLAWTDRNKASMALSQITVGRDSTLLAALGARAIAPLLDIARWTDPGHAFPGLVILGRIEGRSDDDIFSALKRDDRKAIIDEAERMLHRPANERESRSPTATAEPSTRRGP